MAELKWHDGKANYTGTFKTKHNGDWKDMSDGYSTPANASETITLESDFDGSSPPYPTYVTLTSASLNKGVRLQNPNQTVSFTINTGTTNIELRASVLVSDDPKVNITTGRGGTTAICDLSWNGVSWTFGGSGAPATGGDTFNVAAETVTINVTNTQSNTHSSIYIADNSSNTVGTIVANDSGSTSAVLTSSPGLYTVNVFEPLETPATLFVT